MIKFGSLGASSLKVESHEDSVTEHCKGCYKHHQEFVCLFQTCLADFRARGGRVLEEWSHHKAPSSDHDKNKSRKKVNTFAQVTQHVVCIFYYLLTEYGTRW